MQWYCRDRRLACESREEVEGGGGSSSSSSTASHSSKEDEEAEILIKTVQDEEPRPREGNPLMEHVLLLLALVWILVGIAVVAVDFEEEAQSESFVTSVYFVVQVITTVGYGDMTPKSAGMRLFMAFYVFMGNILGALVISTRLQGMVRRSRYLLKAKVVSRMVHGSKAARLGEAPATEPVEDAVGAYMPKVVLAFLQYMAFIVAGVLYFGFFSVCVCGGSSECEATRERCEETGGHLRSLADSIYMSVITLTTVGFGDEVPSTAADRVFATFWMLFGVASMANFLAELAHAILLSSMETMSRNGMSHELFKKIDQDGSGTLTKFEFTTFMLVKYGLVSEEDLDLLILEFEKFDRDGNGELEYEEIIAGDEQPRRHSHAPMLQ